MSAERADRRYDAQTDHETAHAALSVGDSAAAALRARPGVDMRVVVHGRGENEAASELGATVYMDSVAGDPARLVGRQEGHHRSDVVRLGHALQRLHAEHDFATRLSL